MNQALTALGNIEGFSTIVIGVLIFIAAIIFRKQIGQIINWVTGFSKIGKTNNGYIAESSGYRELEASETNTIADSLEEKTHRSEKTDAGNEEKDENWYSYLLNKDYDKAEEILLDELDSTHNESETLMTKCYIGHVKIERNFQDGVKYLEDLINKYPEEEEPYWWLSLSYKNKELLEEAIQVVLFAKKNKVLDSYSSLLDIHVDCLVSLGRQEEAVNILDEKIADHHTDINLHLKVAKIMQNIDKDIAIKRYKKAIKICPDNEKLLNQYSIFLYDIEDSKTALKYRRKLVEIAPENYEYWGLLGNVYLNLGFNDRALEVYKKACDISETNNNGWVLGNIGNIYKNQGFYTQAIEYLEKAAVKDPESEYIHNRLAKAIELRNKEIQSEEETIRKVTKEQGGEKEDKSDVSS